MLEGIDLSSNNGTGHDWAAIKAAGKSFAIVKRSEGIGYLDPTLESNWAGARGAAMVPGGYHFAHPGLNSAEAEAAYFLDHLPVQETGDLAALDLEVEGGPNVATWAIRFGQAFLRRAGFPPLLYTFSAYAVQWLHDPGLAFMPLWLADWGTVLPATFGPWREIALWQYSGSGSCPGIAGQVDLSRIARDLAGLKALGKPAPTPAILTGRVTVPGMLKRSASHASKAVPNPTDPDQPYELPVGTALTLLEGTGKDPTTGEMWQAVQVVKPKAAGWFLAASVAKD